MAIKKLQQGFTLVEMLIVVGIFAVVATILLFNYSDFSTSVGVRNLAQEIGLSVRKAQSYATSVRTISGTSGVTSNTFPAFGISFSVDSTASQKFGPTRNNFDLFADVSPSGNRITNNSYDNNGTCGTPGDGQECLEDFGINTSNSIVALCTDVPVAGSCLTEGTGGTVNVVFHRPSPDAVICVSTVDCSLRHASYVKVTVRSPKGLERIVTVWNTGQISVN
jgi:prepilin-type N-terminal cleavage/methylation domain-containing protein